MRIFRTSVLVAVAALTLIASGVVSANMLLNPGLDEFFVGTNLAKQYALYWTKFGTGGVSPSPGSTFQGSGALSIWPLSDGTTATQNPDLTWTPDPADKNSQRVKLSQTGGGSRGGIYQQVTTVAGTMYTFSAWILTRLSSVSAVEAHIGVENGALAAPTGNTDWSPTISGNSVWVQLSLDIEATGSAVTVFLEGANPTSQNAQCNVFFDNTSFTGPGDVPEPSSLLALLAGLPAVGLAIRRRK